jgi:hypothetical protein
MLGGFGGGSEKFTGTTTKPAIPDVKTRTREKSLPSDNNDLIHNGLLLDALGQLGEQSLGQR